MFDISVDQFRVYSEPMNDDNTVMDMYYFCDCLCKFFQTVYFLFSQLSHDTAHVSLFSATEGTSDCKCSWMGYSHGICQIIEGSENCLVSEIISLHGFSVAAQIPGRASLMGSGPTETWPLTWLQSTLGGTIRLQSSVIVHWWGE